MAIEPSHQKTLYLVDGHAQFFRAYHAIRTPMSSPVTKEPTNLTYGFVGMLLKILRQYKPDYLAVVIDAAGDRETFRSEIYPEYKANRKPSPEDMGVQIERCLSILGMMKVPVIAEPGVEADDAIATIVRKLQRDEPNLRIRIVSKDKDLTQLLSENVELVDVHKDTSVTAADTFGVEGVKPEHVIDILTLMGDTVDNVPGVPGVGPKTAAELILKYGSVANMLANIGEIKGKRRENIEAAKDVLALSAKLVRLKEDVPLVFDLDSARSDPKQLPVEEMLAMLREVGFNRYQDEVKALAGMAVDEKADSGGGGGPAKRGGSKATPQAAQVGGLFAPAEASPSVAHIAGASTRGVYESITTVKQLDALIKRIRKSGECAIDTETSGLSFIDDRLCGICISIEPMTGAYIPVRSPTPDAHLDEAMVIAKLKPILEDESIRKIGHNLKFDINILRRAGVRLKGIEHDTMVASYLIDGTRSSHKMDVLSLALLNHTCIPITDLIGTGKDQRSFESVPLDRATEYAAEDADVTLRLRDCMAPELKKLNLEKLFTEVEMLLVDVLAELEWNGIRVEPDELDRQRTSLEKQVATLRKQIQEESPHPFNPDSPKQLALALFNKPDAEPPGLGLKPLKRGKTGPSTDQEVLDKLAGDPTIESPIPRLIVEYRQLTKLVNTYLLALKEAINARTGRIHASFNQTVAVTGRLSSSDPNLQNIPIRTDVGREIRRAFVAETTQRNWLNGFEREFTAEALRTQRGSKTGEQNLIADGLFGESAAAIASPATPSPSPRPQRLSGESPSQSDEPNVLITADYSQIELRLLAHLSDDAALIDAFHKGLDIHTAVAAEVFGVEVDHVNPSQRNSAKMVNFGIVYGITAFGLARRLQMAGTHTTNEQAAKIIADYKARYSGIATFLQDCIHQAMENGFVETILGRRRPIPEIRSNNPATRALGERYAINTVVQGSAADLIKIAMIDIQRALESQALGQTGLSPSAARMLVQIHDELVFESPRSAADAVMTFVRERMQSAMSLKMPLVVEAAWSENWIDAK